MKRVGIIGAGMVGSAAANALALRESCDEIVLIDQNRAKAQGQAIDITLAAQGRVNVKSATIEELSDADVVILSLGVSEHSGQTRREQFENSASAFATLMPKILERSPEAIFIIAAQPVERMVKFASELPGIPRERVLGTGTVLQTKQLRQTLAQRIGVSAEHIHAQVIGGENAGVILWSNIQVAGLPLEDYLAVCGLELSSADKVEITNSIKLAGQRIVAGKSERHYGIGAGLAKITQAVLHDEHAILTVTVMSEYEDNAMPFALPCLVGREGALAKLMPPLGEDEQLSFQVSLESISRTISELS